ncbi:MAG: ubiquinol-cytochrome c reductase iron-sulfur subunit [Ignavibacteriaceae bacterium]|jgi:Rieske Fe-S protein
MEDQTNVQGQTNRRGFLKFLLTGGLIGFAASIFYPLFSYLKPPKQNEVEVTSVLAGKESDFEPDTGKIIKFGSKPVLLIRLKDKSFRAFTATCTHLACTVQFRNDLGLIWCACHNGKYDLNGRNISGPPPRPLTELSVIKKGKEIYISTNA